MGNSLTAVDFLQSPVVAGLVVAILGPIILFSFYLIYYRFIKKPKIIISDYKKVLALANKHQKKYFARIPIKFSILDFVSDDVLFGEKVIVKMKKADGKYLLVPDKDEIKGNEGYSLYLNKGERVYHIDDWDTKIRRNEVVIVDGTLDVLPLMQGEGPHDIKTSICFKNLFGRKICIEFSHVIEKF